VVPPTLPVARIVLSALKRAVHDYLVAAPIHERFFYTKKYSFSTRLLHKYELQTPTFLKQYNKILMLIIYYF